MCSPVPTEQSVLEPEVEVRVKPFPLTATEYDFAHWYKSDDRQSLDTLPVSKTIEPEFVGYVEDDEIVLCTAWYEAPEVPGTLPDGQELGNSETQPDWVHSLSELACTQR